MKRQRSANWRGENGLKAPIRMSQAASNFGNTDFRNRPRSTTSPLDSRFAIRNCLESGISLGAEPDDYLDPFGRSLGSIAGRSFSADFLAGAIYRAPGVVVSTALDSSAGEIVFFFGSILIVMGEVFALS